MPVSVELLESRNGSELVVAPLGWICSPLVRHVLLQSVCPQTISGARRGSRGFGVFQYAGFEVCLMAVRVDVRVSTCAGGKKQLEKGLTAIGSTKFRGRRRVKRGCEADDVSE